MKSNEENNEVINKIEDFSINLFYCSVLALSLFLVLTKGIEILNFIFYLINKEIYGLLIQTNF